MNPANDPLADVVLAISAYRSDNAVLQLLAAVFDGGPPGFGSVIVVDSLGSGAIPSAARANGWEIEYINSDRNLGSAGNLDLRLRTAAATGRRWCYAVNHDGVVDKEQVESLVSHGASLARVGAVYPQLVFDKANGRKDKPRRSFGAYGVLQDDALAEQDGCTEVVWSSSNCALYRLDAVRDGAHVWPELWMGFEDLALGWELSQRGWAQLLCSDVVVTDSYEFVPIHLLGREVFIASKPSWYPYYELRNLLLIARRSGGKAVRPTAIVMRGLVSLALIILYRDQKLTRMKLLLAGGIDGLRHRAGKGPVP